MWRTPSFLSIFATSCPPVVIPIPDLLAEELGAPKRRLQEGQPIVSEVQVLANEEGRRPEGAARQGLVRVAAQLVFNLLRIGAGETFSRGQLQAREDFGQGGRVARILSLGEHRAVQGVGVCRKAAELFGDEAQAGRLEGAGRKTLRESEIRQMIVPRPVSSVFEQVPSLVRVGH